MTLLCKHVPKLSELCWLVYHRLVDLVPFRCHPAYPKPKNNIWLWITSSYSGRPLYIASVSKYGADGTINGSIYSMMATFTDITSIERTEYSLASYGNWKTNSFLWSLPYAYMNMLSQTIIHDHHANDLRHVLLYSCLHVCYFRVRRNQEKKISLSLFPRLSVQFPVSGSWLALEMGHYHHQHWQCSPFLYNFMDVLKHNLHLSKLDTKWIAGYALFCLDSSL
jgi:hypothetical protein